MTPFQLRKFCPLAAGFYDALTATFARYSINTPPRQAAFLAQFAEESRGFTKLHEIFDYTVDALLAEFPKHITADQAKALGRQPGEGFVPPARQAQIANIIYAGRMGNGDAASGDGAAFRGRGLAQLTGRANYVECGKALCLDLIATPTLLEVPQYAALSAGWYWDKHRLNAFADAGDFQGLTVAINGGLNGLDQRVEWWEEAKGALATEG